MQDDLHYRIAVAGHYTHFRGGRLMQTISAQFYWELVGTIGLRPLY